MVAIIWDVAFITAGVARRIMVMLFIGFKKVFAVDIKRLKNILLTVISGDAVQKLTMSWQFA